MARQRVSKVERQRKNDAFRVRALSMGVIIEVEQKTQFLSHPMIEGYWAASTVQEAMNALDAIAIDLSQCHVA